MNSTENNDEITIDLMELLILLKKHLVGIILSAILFGAMSAAITIFVIPNKYESTARVFPKPETTSGMVDYTTTNANNQMVNNYVEMVKGSTICEKVDSKLGLNTGTTAKSLNVTSQTDTQIITITAATTSPTLSKKIVDNVVDEFYSQLKNKLGVTNVTTIDSAKTATNPSSPSVKKNTAIGVLGGALFAFAIIFVRFLIDTRIRSKDEAESYFGLPVMGVIPDING